MDGKLPLRGAWVFGLFLFWVIGFLPGKGAADSGFVLEKGNPFELNLDLSQGLAFNANAPYRASAKLAPEWQISNFGLGPLGNFRYTNPSWDLGAGVRADWFMGKLLTDTGLKLMADGTYWPDENNASLEGGVLFDLSGIYRISLLAGHDFQQNDISLMLSAGFDFATVFTLAPNPPEPDFQVQPAAPVTGTVNPGPSAVSPAARKVALVISGGGSTGAWAVGALKVLEEYFKKKNIEIFMVCGTSTGSLISSMMATNDPQEKEKDLGDLEKIYTTVSTKDIFDLYSPADMIRVNSVFSTRPLQKTIGGWMGPRWDNLKVSPVEMVIATADMLNNKTVYFYTGPFDLSTINPMRELRNNIELGKNRKAKWATVEDPHLSASRIPDLDTLMRALLASSSDPTLFPLTHIPQGPVSQDQYADGGVLDFIPLEIAFANGAQDVYSIALSPSFPDPVTVQCKDLVGTLMQTIDVLANRVDIADTQEAEDYVDAWNAEPRHQKDPKHLYFIRPEHKIQGDANVFDPVQMGNWMSQGASTATAVIQKWEKYDKMPEAEYQSIPWEKR